MKFQFESLQAFIAMDGYGFYIWTSYAVVLVAMFYFGFRPNWQFKRFVKQQLRIQQQKETISAARKVANKSDSEKT